MRIDFYKDWSDEHYSFHILPGLSLYVTSYIGELVFSWLIWTVELRFKDKE